MKTLNWILEHLDYCQVIGESDLVISTLTFDSRKVTASSDEGGCMYIAQVGTQTDGHRFIDQAIAAGATAIVCEHLPETTNPDICYIVVKDSSIALGKIAAAFYDFPSQSLKLVGITGTNGKTTTVTLLHQLFHAMGQKAGLLSTIVNKVGMREVPATHTTPDAIELNRLLRCMVDEGCRYCFMEVSSHAICQHRIAGLQFAGAIFSNITHDHLDFHKTFANYIQAKKAFFDQLPANAFALTNVDDKNGKIMVQNCAAQINSYALLRGATFKGKILENDFTGLHLEINGKDAYFRLSGKFNAYNFLAIYGTAVLLGIPADEVLVEMSRLETAPGRFQLVRNSEGGVAIIDYAHTPDALKNVLSTIEDITCKKMEILTVVGCGGNRDALKRPIMAEIACTHSDRVILTSDNPRFEDPNAILREMEQGIPSEKRGCVITIENRREAIKTACMMMREKGVILIAGKGHETYQEIQGVKDHFDDMEEVRNNWNIH